MGGRCAHPVHRPYTGTDTAATMGDVVNLRYEPIAPGPGHAVSLHARASRALPARLAADFTSFG